jgi:hypothetical protein
LMEICICFVDISGKGGMIVIQWCLYSAEINIYILLSVSISGSE